MKKQISLFIKFRSQQKKRNCQTEIITKFLQKKYDKKRSELSLRTEKKI